MQLEIQKQQVFYFFLDEVILFNLDTLKFCYKYVFKFIDAFLGIGKEVVLGVISIIDVDVFITTENGRFMFLPVVVLVLFLIDILQLDVLDLVFIYYSISSQQLVIYVLLIRCLVQILFLQIYSSWYLV